ncbi:MAG TPA: hypothetical protein RMH99_12485 [Sandaracinaceae bacterium LLY-WYZ-13_1]|nr:hypothetical protein [Sandaracinaceae bacterium LLY-WYZ-13_1]
MARRPRGEAALTFTADELPDAWRPKKRLPKELREASFFVYWPGDDHPVFLPGRRPGSDATPWMNKRGAAWRAVGWLKEVIQRLPGRAVARLIDGSSLVSRARLTGDFDRRSIRWLRTALRKEGFVVLGPGDLRAAAPAARDDWDGLVLECVAGGGAVGSYVLRWVAGDRRALLETAGWLEDPEAYAREPSPSAVESEWRALHVVRDGRVERTIDLAEHIRVNGARLDAWLANAVEPPRRVRVHWRSMSLPRPTRRRVRPNEEVALIGLGPDDDDVTLLRHGLNE